MKTKNTKELASLLIGDGKKPNKWFVTIAYGWYEPKGDNEQTDMIQADNSLDSVTILAESKTQAFELFDSIKLDRHIKKVTGNTIGQVIVEDRLNGVVIEKKLVETDSGFYIDEYR
jgi:hypothetical protein